MSTNEDKAAIKYVEPSYESVGDLDELARDWELERRVINIALEGTINKQIILNNQNAQMTGPNNSSNSPLTIQTSHLIQPEPSILILSNRGPLGPQPHPVAVTMPSNIGSAFTSQKKRKYSSEYSETVTNPEEPVLKRIRSDNYQIGFIYSAAGVYPVEDVGSAELREWTEDVCSH